MLSRSDLWIIPLYVQYILHTRTMSITENTDVRRLPINFLTILSEILDLNDAWRRLAAIIEHPEKLNEPLYTGAQLNVFENYGKKGKSPSSLLLSDWESRCRIQPTVKVLINYLVKAQLFRAADFVAVDILRGGPLQRPECGMAARLIGYKEQLDHEPVNIARDREPVYGPSVRYGTVQTTATGHSCTSSDGSVLRIPDQESDEGALGGGDVGISQSSTDSFDLNIDGVSHYRYELLGVCTMGFERLLGKGAFGDVYWGQMKVDSDGDVFEEQVAVKILAFHAKDQFLTELRVMAKYRHPNLLPLYGYSNDNPRFCCLISPYMANGSLEDRLAQKNGTKPIPWQTRMTIAAGTARGVSYLHNFGEEPLVHRDIKSANILLDEKFGAKVADFGIARIGGDWKKTTEMMTSKISGTRAYMSNEAFQGNVTVKMDTFSFGIVLLELLTGLAPDDPERENSNLLSHIKEEEKSAEEWMDQRAGEWPEKVVSQLFDIALRCTKGKMKKRPIIEQVVCELEGITDHL